MPDARFRQTVILLVQHDGRGTLGLIVNRPQSTRLEQIFPALPQVLPGELPLYSGGPVSSELVTVLFSGQAAPSASQEVLPGIRLGRLTSLLKDRSFAPDAERVRVFSGVASWAPGQLAAEIARGGWQVRPATAGDLFSSRPDRLCRRLAPEKTFLI